MNPKVSIILPIFKVENYLRKCVDSILSQTLEDIEVILATDGPEVCDEICREYEKKDSRVKLVMHPGSYGKAFNKSMEVATGEYIGIIETDDWVDSQMFEKLYTKAKSCDADVVKGGFYFAFDDESKNYSVLYDGYEENFSIFNQQDFLFSQPSVWSCIYKRDFLLENKIRMIEERMSFIDAPFHYETLYKASKYILLKEPLYYYYQDNPGQTVQNIKVFDGLNAEKIAYKKLIQDKKLYEQLKEGFLFSTIGHLKWNLDRITTKKQKKDFWKAAHEYVVELECNECSYRYFSEELKWLFNSLRKYKTFSEKKMWGYCPKYKRLLKKILKYRRENGIRTIEILLFKIQFSKKHISFFWR